MSDFVRYTIRFIVFMLIQVFVLFQVKPVHQFVVPYLYFLYILWLPFSIPRTGVTLIGFLFGLTLDWFTKTPGLHAAPCTLIAYLRPFLVNILIPQEGADKNYKSPSIVSMGLAPYATYVLILTFLHNTYLVALEWIQIGNFWYFLGKVLATTGVSLFLILITELLFYRKEKFRTNTV
ncbi:MAG: rod shape-determining protein MreD [Candidatus Pseudobacter hemicellulosilyticus]|uniref:Rod shape-determining protein MreD n=1 Tax=Candidatus Pseudobacter hemicellulosilyticus TaxID=3121375 RepID=A0AAJ5WTS1_9BACT|nr:MAG: rod shape-determining protein MreD [Pseudobacter sp.]